MAPTSSRTAHRRNAEAIASEARPFFSISGSDFVEMFVGVGAARARHVRAGEEARRASSSSADRRGRPPSAPASAADDEARTNAEDQLLVEMDGFEGSEGVIDPPRRTIRTCSTRRCVRADARSSCIPDLKGREQITKVHAQIAFVQRRRSADDRARYAEYGPPAPTSSTRRRCSPRARTRAKCAWTPLERARTRS